MNEKTVFITLVSTARQSSAAHLLIDSIRSFAGPMRNYPVWVFTTRNPGQISDELKDLDAEIIPLTVPDSVKSNWFSGKVYSCARAEELSGTNVKSLIWMSSDCLVIQPPELFDLGSSFDAAFRPVHIRNIGLLASDAPDEFWKQVYQAVGVNDVSITVESFVDIQILRAYFNTHAFAINPSKGLMRTWYEIFQRLMRDDDFQYGACGDELHQIFLHQAVLSTLVATALNTERIRMLPSSYNYPYNLQEKIPVHRREERFNELVSIAYEDRSLNPDDMKDIHIDDPHRTWLTARYTR